MKKLLEENEALMQIVNDAGSPPNWMDSPIYKPKFSSNYFTVIPNC